MTEKEKALILRALGSGHITWQCPDELSSKCGECEPAEDAWKTLKRAVQPKPRKRRKP